MKDLLKRQQTLINLITRVGGRLNVQKWTDELIKIDILMENTAMLNKPKKNKNIYKGFELTANAVKFNGKPLPQDRWCLSREKGVVLCDAQDAEFDHNFDKYNYDLSSVKLNSTEESEYNRLKVLQAKVEQSFADGEWTFKSTSSWEQDLDGPSKSVWERWEHPIYGIVEKVCWACPTEYSAEYFQSVTLNVKKAALLRVLRFQEWVDYWEKIDSQPKKPVKAPAPAPAPAPKPTPQIGSLVTHPKWGKGTVLAVMGGNISVKFEKVGNKITEPASIQAC